MLGRIICLENSAMFKCCCVPMKKWQKSFPGRAALEQTPLARTENTPRIAVPSWVLPGTIVENCLFLSSKVDEVALLLLETESCLAYGRQDLPLLLADFGLSFHVHLPTDLPWERGGRAVGGICLTLMEKVNFLGVDRAILHPPARINNASADEGKTLLEDFALTWQKAGLSPGCIFLENIRENDLTGLEEFFGPSGFGLCPDLGHVLAYGQEALLEMLARLPETARPGMLHYSAPGSGQQGKPKSAHRPLDELAPWGREVGEFLLAHLAPGGVIVAELFDWRYIERSLPVIMDWLLRYGATTGRSRNGVFS